MGFKITGLDDLQREMTLLSQVAEALDGKLTTVNFDPHDQTSVERAIADMKLAIDQKVSGFRSSTMVNNLVAELKQKYAPDFPRNLHWMVDLALASSEPSQRPRKAASPPPSFDPRKVCTGRFKTSAATAAAKSWNAFQPNALRS